MGFGAGSCILHECCAIGRCLVHNDLWCRLYCSDVSNRACDVVYSSAGAEVTISTMEAFNQAIEFDWMVSGFLYR